MYYRNYLARPLPVRDYVIYEQSLSDLTRRCWETVFYLVSDRWTGGCCGSEGNWGPTVRSSPRRGTIRPGLFPPGSTMAPPSESLACQSLRPWERTGLPPICLLPPCVLSPNCGGHVRKYWIIHSFEPKYTLQNIATYSFYLTQVQSLQWLTLSKTDSLISFLPAPNSLRSLKIFETDVWSRFLLKFNRTDSRVDCPS